MPGPRIDCRATECGRTPGTGARLIPVMFSGDFAIVNRYRGRSAVPPGVRAPMSHPTHRLSPSGIGREPSLLAKEISSDRELLRPLPRVIEHAFDLRRRDGSREQEALAPGASLCSKEFELLEVLDSFSDYRTRAGQLRRLRELSGLVVEINQIIGYHPPVAVRVPLIIPRTHSIYGSKADC